jgi:ubiquitin-protein ligase
MASKQVTKRLLHELRSYEKDPSDALLHLGPINDQELNHWTAVLKGLPDTAYQSNFTNHSTLPLHLSNQEYQMASGNST